MGYYFKDMMNGSNGYGMYQSNGYNIFGGIMMIVILVLVIVGVVYLIKYYSGYDSRKAGNAADISPLEILKIRYAKGEIKKEEFDEKKKDLS